MFDWQETLAGKADLASQLQGRGFSRGSFPGPHEKGTILVTRTPPASEADRPTHSTFLCGGAKPGLLRARGSLICEHLGKIAQRSRCWI